MAEIAGLDAKLEQVIGAAITAEMRQWGFEGDLNSGFTGTTRIDREHPALWEVHVTYPDAYVTHGGSPTDAQPLAPVRQIYDKWPRVIPQEFERFRDLPDPVDFEPDVDTLVGVINGLDVREPDAQGGGAHTTLRYGNSDLADLVGDLTRELTQYNGEAMDTLDNHFVDLAAVLAGQRVVATVLGALVAGEQRIWRDARDDVEDIAEKARQAFEAHGRGDGGIVPVLKVAKSVTTALSAFINDRRLQVVHAAVDILNEWVKPPVETKPPALAADSADGILNNVRTALGTLGTSVAGQEDALRDCATSALTEIDRERRNYDVHAPNDFLGSRSDKYFLSEDGIDLRTTTLRNRAGQVMKIAEIISEIRGDLAETLGRSRWERHASVGLGSFGHYPEYADLHGMLTHLLSRDCQRLEEVAERMVLVSHDFDRTEGQIAEDLGRLAKATKDRTPDHVQYGY